MIADAREPGIQWIDLWISFLSSHIIHSIIGMHATKIAIFTYLFGGGGGGGGLETSQECLKCVV